MAHDAVGPRADAEAHLLSLELFGMRFGLDRMRRLLTVLGLAAGALRRRSTSSGTNGKSSTVRMHRRDAGGATALRTGAYLSPHLTSFAERIRIGDADLEPRDVRAPPSQRAARGRGQGRPHAGRRRAR